MPASAYSCRILRFWFLGGAARLLAMSGAFHYDALSSAGILSTAGVMSGSAFALSPATINAIAGNLVSMSQHQTRSSRCSNKCNGSSSCKNTSDFHFHTELHSIMINKTKALISGCMLAKKKAGQNEICISLSFIF